MARGELQLACRQAWGGSTLIVYRGEELFEAAGYYPPMGADVVVKEIVALPAFQVLVQNAEAHVTACENQESSTSWLTFEAIQAACESPTYEVSLPFALAVIVRQTLEIHEVYHKLLSPVGGHLRDYWEAVELLYRTVQHFTAQHCRLFELAGTFHAQRKLLVSAAAGQLDMPLEDDRIRADPERAVESGQDFMRTYACRLFGCPHDTPKEFLLPGEMRGWDQIIRPMPAKNAPVKKPRRRGSRGTKRSRRGQHSPSSPAVQPKQTKKTTQAPVGTRPGPSTRQSSVGASPTIAATPSGEGSQPGPSTSGGGSGSPRQ
jgi:hypothetical protein